MTPPTPDDVQAALDAQAKPPGALGRLDALAACLGRFDGAAAAAP